MLWLESGKKRMLKDIAEELQVSEEQVRKWKNQDKWDKVTLPNANSNVTNRKGGQPGNKNAEGHGPPQQNKNAVKTGEFETLFFDTMDPEEKEILGMVQLDKGQLLLQEIQLLTIRERRMLKRINNLRQVEDVPVRKEKDGSVISGMTVVEYAVGIEKGKKTDLKKYQGILGQIQSIEDALTRVQARRQRAIEALHKFGYDDAKLELDAMKLELELQKLDGQEEGECDDGFMEAMNAVAASVWGDENE